MEGLWSWAHPSDEDARRHPPAQVYAAGEKNHHISNTAYPIAHGSTWKPYRVQRERHRDVVLSAWEGVNDLCLYVHIPFCEVRCSFCEYTVVGRNELSQTEQYMAALTRELSLYEELLGTERRTLHGFDIGGGTPSYVSAESVAELIDRARRAFVWANDFDISIETTPKIAATEPDKLHAYFRCGIRRISMGVQVIQPDLLKMLNRDGQGAQLHHQAVENIRAAGFEKFNIDLMYGFADQSLESWKATLEHALKLNPEYVTLYRMRYKLTRISHQAPRVQLEAVRAQAALAKKMLMDAGFQANPGKNTYSRIEGDVGTSDYLRRRVVEGMPYLGLGLGAQTFTPTTISYNDGSAGKTLGPYLRSIEAQRPPLQDLYHLPLEHMVAKMVAVSFYFGEINRKAFTKLFGTTVEQRFPREVDFVLENGLMEDTGAALSLTARGAQSFNGVIALFFAPSVQEYLLKRDPDQAEDMHKARSQALRVAELAERV